MKATDMKTQTKSSFTASVWFVAVAGAVGVGLQNFLAFFSFLLDLGRLGPQLAQGLAIAFGGAVSGIVNLWMNLGLLEDFFKRITGETPMPKMQGWKKFRYWAGSLIFIITGVLFGMTAFAFGGQGVLASISIASGVLVAAIMMIQELETWLSSFDEKKKKAQQLPTPTSFNEAVREWWKNLTPAKSVAFIISAGNVLALSLLFAFGLTSFLTMSGVPLVPAITAAFVVSFTAGAFTEFYFYNFFLAKFCEKVAKKWQKFLELPLERKLLGIACVSINAVVNAALAYAGIILFNSLMASAGLSALPVAVVIVAAVFCGMASAILGANFWLKTLAPSKKKEVESSVNTVAGNEVVSSLTDTAKTTAAPILTTAVAVAGEGEGEGDTDCLLAHTRQATAY